MNPIVTLVRDTMGDSILQYALVMERTLKDTVKRAAKGITRRVIDITPPAFAGVKGAAAYRHGRKKIARQMGGVLAPVKLKGRRLITHVYGHQLAKPVYVRTAEKYTDVVAVYRQNRTFRNKGVGVRSRGLRSAKYFVDVRKFNTLLKAKEARVGVLASGWAAAAAALDVPLQNWISRHGQSRGTVKLDLASARMRIVVSNFAGSGLPENVAAELDRRIAYAVQYQRDAMAREVRYMMGKKAQELAIKTRNFDGVVPPGMFGGAES